MMTQIQKIANPQGKGLVNVVDDLRSYEPIHVKAKSAHQWLADYFTSSLILSAKYGFKPIVAKDYYLYFKNAEWKLSLIEPEAWKSHSPGTYFATCNLNPDMSWSIELVDDWQQDPLLVKTIYELESAFVDSLNNENFLLENLPFYLQHLSYYQRLCANALARSLKQSLEIKLGKDNAGLLESKKMLTELDSQKKLILKNN